MKRIHCAEDDPGLQEVFPLIFTRAGYEITMFSSGEDLLKQALAPPDLYLIDKQLSGLNGMDVCKKLKSQMTTRDIPIIMVSASPDLDFESAAAGANNFLEKPFKVQSLLQLVKMYVE